MHDGASQCVLDNLALRSVVACSGAALSVGFFTVASCGKSHRKGRIAKISSKAANLVRVAIVLTSQLGRVSQFFDGRHVSLSGVTQGTL